MQHTSDAQADPLVLAGPLGGYDGGADLLVALIEVLDDLLALLLDLRDLHLLLDDERVHVLEELGQLDHLLLDALQGGLAVLHGAEDGAGLALAAALHHGLLEDLAAAADRGVLDGLAHLRLGRLRPHDAVLPRHLVLRLLTEGRLDLLELLDGLLEAAVDAAHLARVAGLLGVALRLDRAHPVRQAAVHAHRLGRERVDLAARRRAAALGLVERPVLQHLQLPQVALDAVDALVDAPALVEDGVGVARAEGARVLR